MPVICLGPVCIPIWPLVALILKPLWDLLPQHTREFIADKWYTFWEHLTFIPERFRPPKNDGEVIELEDAEHFDKLAAENKLLVVDYSAEWCKPCQKMAPIFADLALEYKDKAAFVHVDVDECDDLAMDHGVASLPAFRIYQGSETLESIVGADEKKLRAAVSKRCRSH
ncbi:hypothetical protein FOL47_009574 [Perkinsus chesapeaki]|uniref:Thioredoxin domain-containing protein n=1 Tax=Perkinsus chesapeaki TaxID=330153 RepID=A0A7J6L7E3_PERCH|nr:hypothetical protein FOL47_009574 [Perkinsus chesapeaki]